MTSVFVIWSSSLYFHSFNNNKILICKTLSNRFISTSPVHSTLVVPASLTFLYSFLRNEPIRVGIHICLETAQEISLDSYLYLKLAKHHVSLFIFYDFYPTKLETRWAEQVLPNGRGSSGTCVRWEVTGKAVVGWKWCK
jgi:hypothetical protein